MAADRLLISLMLLLTVSCLFKEDGPVVKLTKKNFKSLVLASDELWLVEFYAPWCGHCKHSAPEFEKAAQILKGIVNVGAVDMTVDGEAGEQYKISGFPTIKFFGRDKQEPMDYTSGERTFQKFVQYSMGKVRSEIVANVHKIQGRSAQATSGSGAADGEL